MVTGGTRGPARACGPSDRRITTLAPLRPLRRRPQGSGAEHRRERTRPGPGECVPSYLAGLGVVTPFFVAYFARSYYVVLSYSSTGEDRFRWPRDPFSDWLWDGLPPSATWQHGPDHGYPHPRRRPGAWWPPRSSKPVDGASRRRRVRFPSASATTRPCGGAWLLAGWPPGCSSATISLLNALGGGASDRRAGERNGSRGEP